MYKVISGNSRKIVKEFIKLPFKLYKDDPNWVAPLNLVMKQTLTGKNNALFSNGIHTLLLLKDQQSETVGRLVVGIDEKMNKEKNIKRGYISLFECINDKDAAFTLLDAAKDWLKQKGMTIIEGPVSPTNGDDYRGLLIKGYNTPPSLMNSYNPEYYTKFFEEYGFEKYKDLSAFDFYPEKFPLERFQKVVNYSMKKYNFRIDTADLKKLDREISDIHKVLELAVPESWTHFVIPSVEDIKKEAKSLLRFIDPDFVCIARRNDDDSPIGFVVGAPDYNQVMAKLKGKLFPFGIFKYFYYKKRIDAVRIFIQFVIPEFQGRAVNASIFFYYLNIAREKGIVFGEGGTIGEENSQALKAMAAAGGELSKVYRIFNLEI